MLENKKYDWKDILPLTSDRDPGIFYVTHRHSCAMCLLSQGWIGYLDDKI